MTATLVRCNNEVRTMDEGQLLDDLQGNTSHEDPFQLYDVQSMLGQGGFGSVYKAVNNSNPGYVVAIKKFYVEKYRGRDKRYMITELEIMKRMDHVNVVQMIEAYFYGGRDFSIVMEYMDGGNLSTFIRKTPELTDYDIGTITEEIGKGLHYLHSNGVIHRDIKCQNILLSLDGKVKIADFGLSAVVGVGELVSTILGSPLYMAPEIFRGRYDSKVDVWSLGIIMYRMVKKSFPYQNYTIHETFDLLRREGVPNIGGNVLRTNLIEKCLESNVSKRASVADILKHNFLRQYSRDTSLLIPLIERVNNLTPDRQKVNIRNRLISDQNILPFVKPNPNRWRSSWGRTRKMLLRSLMTYKGSVQLSIRCPEGFTFRPGDWVYLTIKDVSPTAHRVAIASPPNRWFNPGLMELIISLPVDDENSWPNMLYRLGEENRNLPRIVDIQGPYSSFVGELFNTEHAIVIADSDQVSCVSSFLWSFVYRYAEDYYCKSYSSIGQSDTRKLEKVTFLWINADIQRYAWFLEILTEIHKLVEKVRKFLNKDRCVDITIHTAIQLDSSHPELNCDEVLRPFIREDLPNWKGFVQIIHDLEAKRINGRKVNFLYVGHETTTSIEIENVCRRFNFPFTREEL